MGQAAIIVLLLLISWLLVGAVWKLYDILDAVRESSQSLARSIDEIYGLIEYIHGEERPE